MRAPCRSWIIGRTFPVCTPAKPCATSRLDACSSWQAAGKAEEKRLSGSGLVQHHKVINQIQLYSIIFFFFFGFMQKSRQVVQPLRDPMFEAIRQLGRCEQLPAPCCPNVYLASFCLIYGYSIYRQTWA